MLTQPPVRQLLHIPGRSEVTAVEFSDETLLTAIVHGFEARVTDLAATLIAVADQYPNAFIEWIEGIPEGGWIVDLVARTDA